MIRLNREMLFVVSLLVLAIASTNVPAVSAQARVGKIILDPTHAVPKTLVSFEGEGWRLPASDPDVIQCWIRGEPVKFDQHSICEIGAPKGAFEPVGTFVVKDVPAGAYSVFVVVTMYSGLAFNLTGEAKFIVDGATTIATTVVTTTPASPVTSPTSAMTTAATSTPIVPATVTVTTTKEPATIPQAFDYPVMLALILAVIVVILILILIRRTRSSR